MKMRQIVGYCCIALLLITSNIFAESSKEKHTQTYSNGKWEFSFNYPRSWDSYSNSSFTEKTRGLWNVPDELS